MNIFKKKKTLNTHRNAPKTVLKILKTRGCWITEMFGLMDFSESHYFKYICIILETKKNSNISEKNCLRLRRYRISEGVGLSKCPTQ